MASRTKIAAKGFAGAGAGAHRLIFVDDVETDPKARVLIPDGGIVEIRDAGGGGYGNPDRRSLDDIAADLEAGLISAQFVDDNYPRQARQLARSAGAS
jgi:N-methylhydantoinase B